MIDGIVRPSGVSHRRRAGAFRLLKRPVGGADIRKSIGECAWPSGPGVDPLFDRSDRISREQLALGRHLFAFVECGNESVKGAFGTVSGEDHRAGVATQHRFALAVEPQATLAFVRAVAVEAILPQHRIHLLAEKVALGRNSHREQRCCGTQKCVRFREKGHAGLIPEPRCFRNDL